MKSPTPIEYASPNFFRVMASMFYDTFLLAAISLAYSACVLGFRILFVGQPAVGERIHWSLFASILITVGWLLCLSAFYIYCWRNVGQTLGMKTWRIRMVDAQSNQLASYKQCAQRSFFALCSLAFLGCGYWLQFFHPQQKTFHDLMSGTRLVLLRKE